MPKRIERDDFLQAIANIRNGTPTSAELKKRRSLKLNYSTVAKEAGHARGNIGYDGCAYQDIRDMVTAEMQRAADPELDAEICPKQTLAKHENPSETPGSLQPIIERLRAEKKLLKEEKEMLASQLASATNFIATLQKKQRREPPNASRSSPDVFSDTDEDWN